MITQNERAILEDAALSRRGTVSWTFDRATVRILVHRKYIRWSVNRYYLTEAGRLALRNAR